jgi:hypothetical protein
MTMSLWMLVLAGGLLAAAAGAPPSDHGESIEVRVRGTVRGGLMAIGGETTGTTIRARGVTWELDFGANEAMRAKAEALDGKTALVTGSLEARAGVESKNRWIVTVETIEAAESAAPKPPAAKKTK